MWHTALIFYIVAVQKYFYMSKLPCPKPDSLAIDSPVWSTVLGCRSQGIPAEKKGLSPIIRIGDWGTRGPQVNGEPVALQQLQWPGSWEL